MTLLYAPHLEILDKKKNGETLTEEEEDLMINLTKLKNKSYDRGQDLLSQGDPSEAIRYYEQSRDNGESLSIEQK